MKKFNAFFMLAAVAAVAVSCQIEDDKLIAGEGIKVSVVTPAPTKTELSTATKVVWQSTDKVGFMNGEADVNVQSSAAVIDGSGRATFTATVPSAGTYYAYYPYFADGSYAPDAEGVTVRILNTQSPTLTSFDPAADILVSDAFVADGSTDTPATIRFRRLGAFIKVNFVDGTTGTKLSGKYATSVAIQGENNLVGRVKVHGVNGLIDKASGYKKVTASYAPSTFEITANTAYFGVLPQTLASGSTLVLTVETEGYEISKTVTMPKDVVLGAGDILPLQVTLTNSDVKSTSVTVSRVWGLYSTSGAAWNESYGGTPNTDRNVAMDANYIYVCETVANTAKIWAISRTNPATVKSVSTTGIVTATNLWPTACPRVLKNTDASINGGDDVLVVGSMSNSEGDFYLYFYLDGIDAAPTPVKLGGYNYRRLGDTFTHWGTLQKGIFFFKDFNAAQVCMSYKIANTSGWDWATVKSNYEADGTVAKITAQGNLMTPNHTGVGSYFPYPDDKNNGFFGIRDGVNAYTVNMPSDVWSASGRVDDIVSTQLGGYFLNATSALYFEVGAYKYVVYTRQVSGKAGGVMFLRGASTDSYADIIAARQAGGSASAVFSIAADSTDPTAENERSSGNGGFDLAAYQVGEDVYVAAVKQNVGLSLFKVSAE